jgi:hypothetical protein
MRNLILFVACLLSLSWSSQALARSNPQAQVKAAKKACAAGDYRKGVEILADLYVDTSDPNYIFNQARCYEQSHQWVNAIDRFREYLLKAQNATASDRNDAEMHLATCKRYQEEEQGKAAPSSLLAPPVAMAPAAVPAPPSPAPIATTPITASPPPAQETGGAALRTTGIVVAGVGLVTLGAAIALNVKSNQLARDASNTQNASTESSQKSYKTGAVICYGTGAAAVVAGGVLYFLGRRSGEEKPAAVALLPSWTPGLATITLSGGF